MANYAPTQPFITPVEVLTPTLTSVKGVGKKTYPEEGFVINASVRAFNGTETLINGAYVVLDTVVVETWFRPDIKSDCRIRLVESGDVYEILGKPEDIGMRHQFLKFKAKAVEGGA